MTIHYAIPAYNEEANLETLVKLIDSAMKQAGLDYHVVIVDDGSTDSTEEILGRLSKDYPLSPVKNERNMGLGRTLRRAIKEVVARAADDDVIVTMDGDATHNPEYVPALVERVDSGADVAIASRFVSGGTAKGVTLYRRFLSRGAGVLLKICFPIKGVLDYTGGFRAFRASVLKRAFDKMGDDFIHETGFSASAEILLNLRKLNAAIQEVPYTLRYDLKGGESKIKLTRTIMQYVKLIGRLKLKA